MTHLTDKNLQELKEKLEKEAGEIEAQLSNYKKNPDFGDEVESDFSGVEADEAEEYANSLDLVDTLKKRLADIDSALDKIIKNKYGYCEKCNKEISLEVLKVNPESRICKDCKVSH